MNDISQGIIQSIEPYKLSIVLPVVLAVLAFATVLYMNRTAIKQQWLYYKTRNGLNRLGYRQISNFKCPDGLGNFFTIDRLVLRQHGISLLLYKRYPGKIYCADHIDNWTQMLGNKSYYFKNPLNDLGIQIRALSACIPGVPVNGFLFFDHLSEFPRGHPEKVIHLNRIPQELRPDKHNKVEAGVMLAWEKLTLMADSAQGSR